MKKLLLFAFLLTQVLMANAQYCSTNTTSLHWDHQIQYFQFDSLINVTSNVNPQPYNDYSATKIINTKLGGKHYVLLSKGQNPFGFMSGNTVGFSIWIDFNNDFTFSSNERVYSKYNNASPGGYTSTDTIIFPANATTGTHRLRVRSGWGEAPTVPCGSIWGGEAEDYTIKIAAGNTALSAPEAVALSELEIYPNPSANFFKLDLNKAYQTVDVKIADLTGKLIKVHTFKDSSQIKFDIAAVPGIYLATVQLGNYSKVFKLIKQ